MAERSARPMESKAPDGRRLTASFDGGRSTSDGRRLLLRRAEDRCRVLKRFGRCFTGFRAPPEPGTRRPSRRARVFWRWGSAARASSVTTRSAATRYPLPRSAVEVGDLVRPASSGLGRGAQRPLGRPALAVRALERSSGVMDPASADPAPILVVELDVRPEGARSDRSGRVPGTEHLSMSSSPRYARRRSKARWWWASAAPNSPGDREASVDSRCGKPVTIARPCEGGPRSRSSVPGQ